MNERSIFHNILETCFYLFGSCSSMIVAASEDLRPESQNPTIRLK